MKKYNYIRKLVWFLFLGQKENFYKMLKEICLKVCNDKNATRRIYFRAEFIIMIRKKHSSDKNYIILTNSRRFNRLVWWGYGIYFQHGRYYGNIIGAPDVWWDFSYFFELLNIACKRSVDHWKIVGIFGNDFQAFF